ncbi:hypothetical protein LJC63_00840 [Ruminococcaceae bacterium OttesenSCG-928-L11]|nr:hypothetical protein [Ruminococcaceae bacterium OttesenSCG-928-L11]
MVVQHNIPALNSHRYLGINNKATSSNLEKLSSGYRINRAADDAAGLAISEKMRGQISGLGMAEQNANNGISLIQTAEGALNETHSILQRMRELAVQSSNGTYQDEDRAQIELEYQALKQEIDRIASYTNYNGIKLLDGTVGGTKLTHASAAEALTGSQADIMKAMGITAGTAPTITFNANSATITKSDKTLTQDVKSSEKIDGFGAALNAATVATVKAAGGGVAESSELMYTVDAFADVVLTKNDDGTWAAGITSNNDAFSGATATFVTNGTSSGKNGLLTVTARDGSQITLDLGAYTEKDVGGAGADLGGHAAGTTISLSAHIKTTAGNNASSEFTAKVRGETVLYDTDAATGGSQNGSLSFSWNTETSKWDVTGKYTLESASASKAYTEVVEVKGTLDPTGTGTVDLVGVLSNNSTVKFQLNAGGFGVPTEPDLYYGSFRLEGAPGAATLAGVEAYKYDEPAKETPAQERANQTLKSMGISNVSKFDVNKGLATGSTEEQLIYDALNNKDAYIITRQSTAVADKGDYDATERYETVLQVNGKSYLGELNGTTWNFKDENGTTVASLTNSKEATESGTVYFNTGDQDSEYYKDFIIKKESAMIGSENVSNLVFQIGANGNEDQRVGMYVFNMSSDNLGNHEKGMFVSESTIKTIDDANQAVDTLDNAIVYVASQRANLGALQNRLEHTLNNLGVTKENLTAAESSIRDVDMAKEMMEFTKNNILVQASQAMLAQANSLPQGVLSLLR